MKTSHHSNNQPTVPEPAEEAGGGAPLPLLVGLVSNHLPGAGCMCSAWNDSECGCANVDWRPRREVALEKALEYCLKKLKAHHLSRTGIPETIRNTEAIRDAGTRQPNAIGHA